VCAMGTGHFSPNMQMGRCWYMFRYWGVKKEHLAVLNGGASHVSVMDPSYLSGTVTCDENTMLADPPGPDCLPRSGLASVRNLQEDNTALQATVEDVIAIAEGRNDAFLWDARSENEYTAVQGVSGAKYLGIDFRGTPSGTAPKQGHPNTAVLLPYGNLLDSANGYSYKPKSALLAYLNGEEVDGASFVRYDAGSLVPLGAGNAYQTGQTVVTYCETTFRAMITGIASTVVLGLPNQFYDGAMNEWNALSSIQNKFGELVLPADSPWRTDLITRSHFEYNTPADIDPQGIDDPYAANSRLIIDADKAYKRGTSASDDGSSDGGLPPNACGG
jgi:3-mercaptopyruvate sulfurtransferase SseA